MERLELVVVYGYVFVETDEGRFPATLSSRNTPIVDEAVEQLLPIDEPWLPVETLTWVVGSEFGPVMVERIAAIKRRIIWALREYHELGIERLTGGKIILQATRAEVYYLPQIRLTRNRAALIRNLKTHPFHIDLQGSEEEVVSDFEDYPTVVYTHHEIHTVHGYIPSMTTGRGPEIRFRFLDPLLPPIGCTSGDVPTDADHRNNVRRRVVNAVERFYLDNKDFARVKMTRIVIGRVSGDVYNPSLSIETLMAMTDTRVGILLGEE